MKEGERFGVLWGAGGDDDDGGRQVWGFVRMMMMEERWVWGPWDEEDDAEGTPEPT